MIFANNEQADNMKTRTQGFRQFIQDRVNGKFEKPSPDVYVVYRTFHAMFGRTYWPLTEESRNQAGDGLKFIDKIISPYSAQALLSQSRRNATDLEKTSDCNQSAR